MALSLHLDKASSWSQYHSSGRRGTCFVTGYVRARSRQFAAFVPQSLLCSVAAVARCCLRRLRRWPTGHLVHLQHPASGHSFEFLVERRGKSVLLSSPAAPFERMALPSPLPEPGGAAGGKEPIQLRVALAKGTDSDWQLLWQVHSYTGEDGKLCLEIHNARRSDLLLSSSEGGRLVLRHRALERSQLCYFQELYHEEGHRRLQAAPPANPADGLLSQEDLHRFARDGYIVMEQAVPPSLWQPASALVHSELGRPGGLVEGGNHENSGFDALGKLQGGTCNRPQFRQLLLHPSSVAGACAAQLLGVHSLAAMLGKKQLPCQVALRFPDPVLSEAEAPPASGGRPVTRARRIKLEELRWHTDGCHTRQCSRNPFSLLVGIALSDCNGEGDELCGNLCVWPGSHKDLSELPALGICDPGVDISELLSLGAPLAGYEGLEPGQKASRCPGEGPVALRLCAGDCVILNPHTAHAAAPRYLSSGIRSMAYFRLRSSMGARTSKV
eukprot:TRINITY_DN31955_c0_g1_i2.p1 TRINITY_DN31955_c0_g1~~TRINITY_DN31955_c0_g1_i2.p1  ORF type:complete len:499 (+),score=82.09 TRINITY_DN31955_c0_g1_i2:33-1529(+)